jgi:hypothetical protein
MSNGLSADLCVKRRMRDGWHVYTCDQLPGLLVAAKDDRIAYEDVPDAIRTLIRLDYGVECTVTHKVEYSEFLSHIRLGQQAREAVLRRTDELMDDDTNFLSFTIAQTTSDGAQA